MYSPCVLLQFYSYIQKASFARSNTKTFLKSEKKILEREISTKIIASIWF